jgi:hypothetical protein
MSKPILVYDISQCPMGAGLDMETVMKIYEEERVVFYDSLEGNPGFKRPAPFLYNGEGIEIKSIDLGETQMTKEEIKKFLDEVR